MKNTLKLGWARHCSERKWHSTEPRFSLFSQPFKFLISRYVLECMKWIYISIYVTGFLNEYMENEYLKAWDLSETLYLKYELRTESITPWVLVETWTSGHSQLHQSVFYTDPHSNSYTLRWHSDLVHIRIIRKASYRLCPLQTFDSVGLGMEAAFLVISSDAKAAD